MILHGNSRGGAGDLARHLLRDDENDHVTVHEIRGFMADDVEGAFKEVDALSRGTRCEKFLFSLSLSPPHSADCSDKDFEKAIAKAEKSLGLDNQPRVIVFHEKGDNRDRHAHVVWSRIDVDEMKAIPLPYNRMKMREVSRDLFIEHGWDVPCGLINREERNPLNFTLEEYQHAKRIGKDARQIKQDLQDAWAMSDNAATLQHALNERGFRLAKGDRRSFVAVDAQGEVFSLPKQIGIKTKALSTRIGKDIELQSVSEAQTTIARDMTNKMSEYDAQLQARSEQRKQYAADQRKQLVERQRVERANTTQKQETRRIEEAQARQAKFRHGLKGLWDWMRGENARIKKDNEAEAQRAQERDTREKSELTQSQRTQRQWLANRQIQQKQSMSELRNQVMQDHARYKDMSEANKDKQREEFKRQRRATSERQPRRSRGHGPER